MVMRMLLTENGLALVFSRRWRVVAVMVSGTHDELQKR
jgi:hypothetical protein